MTEDIFDIVLGISAVLYGIGWINKSKDNRNHKSRDKIAVLIGTVSIILGILFLYLEFISGAIKRRCRGCFEKIK